MSDRSWRAQPGPQLEAVQKAWCPELLFGGAAGGGKTAFLIGDFCQDVPTEAGPYTHGILFRQTLPQLEEVIKQSQEIIPGWFDPQNEGKVRWKEQTKTWHWINGATLKMRYAEQSTDWMQYQGHQYTWIGWDELTTWASPENYLRMKARLRSPHPEVKFKRIRATANPGGPGHEWVKEYFSIGAFPTGRRILTPEDGSGMDRMFIPSRVQDNQILLRADPGYINRLRSLGSPALVKAWLEGDWNVVQGAYFPEFDVASHVIRPFNVPSSWTRVIGMDWGSAAPAAIYWGAVSDGNPLPDGRAFPRGSIIVYREWYVAVGANKGAKLTAEQIGIGIMERTPPLERITDFVLDPSAFATNGGPSIAERMMRAVDGQLSIRRADNKRIPGWDQVRDRLKGMGFEDDPKAPPAWRQYWLPMLYFFETCPHAIRTLPSIQHDDTNPEDTDTDGEDHAADAIRYLCMSRPWIRDPVAASPNQTRTGWNLDELWESREQHERWRR